jgi:predicted unusual protein kinase regulating ubiquinone biosynthesis (AarF/ABC1/UbiB family)
MRFLSSILFHRIAWNKAESLAQIKAQITGVVNVRLAQFLSNFHLIVGEDVAQELCTLTHDAPAHCLEESKRIVFEDFGETYKLDKSALIGSGSIAQIHKLAGADIVIKVVHPHADGEVQDALAAYRSIQDSWFVSSNLKIVCDIFFEGLVAQLDMRTEHANIAHFIGEEMYVCPKPIASSKRCLVMRYEPSTHLCGRDIPEKVRMDAYSAINRYSMICLERGWIHADMHQGNFGVRYTDNHLEAIVIYDFGFVYDLSEEIPQSIREELVAASGTCDFVRHKNALIRVMEIDAYDTSKLNLSPKLAPFTRNIERLILFYFATCNINAASFKLFSSMEKYYPYVKALIDGGREI